MPLEFGTDGVRGIANAELTPELVLALGRAAARVLGAERWIVGRDTRRSGPMLEAAFLAGVSSEGAAAVDLGVFPTPAVAFQSQIQNCPAAVVSASHNAFSDNGIKLFAAGGRKLDDATEGRLEHELANVVSGSADRAMGRGVGSFETRSDSLDAYTEHLVAALDGSTLDGLRVVLDCANGAASGVAAQAFRRAGASVDVLFDQPDGTNINDGCGSTHPWALQREVVERGADAGLAFDGDADRVVAVDHLGSLVDGDHILAICAGDLLARGRLASNTVVVTVMTNLGFHLAMADRGIAVQTTAVGDRAVLEALEAGGLSLGGEQSGHIIFPDVATTGDGALTGLRLLDTVRRSGRTLHELAAASMTRLPQVLRNVRVADRDGLEEARPVWLEVAAVESELAERGRVLLRPSGTEPVIRVMVEAPTEAEAEAAADRLCQAVTAVLGEA